MALLSKITYLSIQEERISKKRVVPFIFKKIQKCIFNKPVYEEIIYDYTPKNVSYYEIEEKTKIGY